LTESDVPVTTSSGIHGPPIAEWTLLSWLVASRKFSQTYEDQKKHVWGSHDQYVPGIQDHVGKKIGILGYGSIGRQSTFPFIPSQAGVIRSPSLSMRRQETLTETTVARVSVALGATVHAFTATPKPTPASRRDPHYFVPGTGDPEGTLPASWHHGIDKASLHSFLSLGLDHVVVSLPLTPQTTHLLGAEEFAVLAAHRPAGRSRNPFLTNISRGKVIDQDALVAALEKGELSGAALDVTDPEPLPADHPLWDAPNVQISPHISGIGEEYWLRSFDILRVNLDRSRRGESLVNAYKRGRGY
jgi:phosphoglycerate dehydrogenase-like enzyme